VFTHVTGNLRKIAKPDVFPVEDNLPDDIHHWIAYWSRNPEGIPRPIREEHGLLIVEDIDVWLWGRHVAPKAYKDEFLDVLWEIFIPLGQWEELVDGAWVVPRHPSSPQPLTGRVLGMAPGGHSRKPRPQPSREMAQSKRWGYPHQGSKPH